MAARSEQSVRRQADRSAFVPRYQELSVRFLQRLNARDLVFEFFVVFSRFEYALIQTGFIRKDVDYAAADWDQFGRELNQFSAPPSVPEIDQATSYLLNHPPRKQIRENGALVWKEALPNENEPQLYKLLVYIRRIRNNLFHGNKLSDLLQEHSARNVRLLSHSLTVLYACLDLHAELQDNFLGELRHEMELAEEDGEAEEQHFLS